MKAFRLDSRPARAGFTLVEILVSIAVLGLMMVGVAQMMNSALSATIGGYKHLDADTQARLVLDRMAFDISKMTKRTDVDYYFKKNTTVAGTTPGNDQMAFYSESGGYYPDQTPSDNSNVSLVGYMVVNNQLCRLSKGLTWNGYSSSLPAMVFNPSPATGVTGITNNTLTNTTWNGSANGIANGTDPNYQVIGDQVFRLEYCFLVQTSALYVPSSKTVTQTYLYDYPWESANYINNGTITDSSPLGMKDVTAIVVSIAVLDSKSRAAISSSTLTKAGSYLKDDTYSSQALANSPSPPTGLPVTLWKTQLTSTVVTPKYLGLPKSVASQVRFYQRYCYLNHLQ